MAVGKLIIVAVAIALFAMILVMILGNPFPGFSVLSLFGLDSGAGTEPRGMAAFDAILKENPELGANLDAYSKEKLSKLIEEENPNMSKEDVQKLIEGTIKPLDEADWNSAMEELQRRLAQEPPKEISEEFSITIGGKTYTQKDLANMSPEELEELRQSMTPEERAFIESQPGGGQK